MLGHSPLVIDCLVLLDIMLIADPYGIRQTGTQLSHNTAHSVGREDPLF